MNYFHIRRQLVGSAIFFILLQFCVLSPILYLLGPPYNVFFQLVFISWILTLSSCLICQIISFSLPSNEYVCVYAWTMLGKWACDRLTEDADFGKKNHFFRWSSFWSWGVCKQTKLSHLWYRKPTRIHWKVDSPKTSHWLVWTLAQRHNWAIFLFTKIEEKDIGNIWFQQHVATPKLHSIFCRSDVV